MRSLWETMLARWLGRQARQTDGDGSGLSWPETAVAAFVVSPAPGGAEPDPPNRAAADRPAEERVPG